jgi:hypothetical protein
MGMGKVEDQAYLVFVDRHIEELEERILAMTSRMSVRVLKKYEAANQAVLLSSMLEARKNIERFRAELIATFNATYGDSQ